MRARAVVLILVGAFGLAGSVAAGTYSGGTGEPNDPYKIATPNDLNDIGNHVEDFNKCFVVMNDINLADYNGTQFNIIGHVTSWFHTTPIGVEFSGVFDGNSNVIYGFAYCSTERDSVGLFGFVDDVNAEVRNLTLISPDVNAGMERGVGSLVGVLNAGHVLDCNVQGGSVSGGNSVGGLVGCIMSSFGKITDCYSTAQASGRDHIGGLVGYNAANIVPGAGGTIDQCFASGSVTGVNAVGGLVGTSTGSVSYCSASAHVQGDNQTGGLVGDNYLGSISYCYSTGTVDGNDMAGGLVGENRDGTISNCYALGDVNGISGAGGLIGHNGVWVLGGTVSNCYAAGDIEGTSGIGGLVGYDANNSWISYRACFWDVTANPDVNGIGNSNDPNVIGKPTAEMMAESTFTDAGWDFVEVWDVGENQTYPFLRVYPTGDLNHNGIVNFIDVAILADDWLEGVRP